jgi:hypothetical protein
MLVEQLERLSSVVEPEIPEDHSARALSLQLIGPRTLVGDPARS